MGTWVLHTQVDIWGWLIPCVHGGAWYSCHCRLFSSISDFNLLHARKLAPVQPELDKKYLQTLPYFPQSATMPPSENHCGSLTSLLGIYEAMCLGFQALFTRTLAMPALWLCLLHLTLLSVSLFFSFPFCKWGHCLLPRINEKNKWDTNYKVCL